MVTIPPTPPPFRRSIDDRIRRLEDSLTTLTDAGKADGLIGRTLAANIANARAARAAVQGDPGDTSPEGT